MIDALFGFIAQLDLQTAPSTRLEASRTLGPGGKMISDKRFPLATKNDQNRFQVEFEIHFRHWNCLF